MGHVEDLNMLQRMKVGIQGANATKLVLDEVLQASRLVNNWVNSVGQCYAKANYDDGAVSGYDVHYEFGNLGNLVHELTHVVNHLTYKRNFVNYDHRTTNPTEEQFNDLNQILLNEAARQDHWRQGNGDNRASTNLSKLRRFVERRKIDSRAKREILTKIDYGIAIPHLEYTTVLHQILIWCNYGVPVKNVVRNAEGQPQVTPAGQLKEMAGILPVSSDEMTQAVSAYVEWEYRLRHNAAAVTGGASTYNVAL